MKKLLILIIALFVFSSFTEKEITWIAIGDSITYLNDHPDETGYRVTKGYLTGVTVCYGDVDHLIPGQTDQAIS
jgi:hypothetical protein